MNDFENKYKIFDEITPVNAPLSAKHKRSFAYYTIQHRLPIIVTKIIDQQTRDKDELAEIFDGDVTRDDVKEIIAYISQLKYELQTDKEFALFTGQEVDKDVWNNFIEKLGENRTFFSVKWLYAECYLYRRIKSIFEETKTLKDYDYFRKQKDTALNGSLSAIALVVKHTNQFYNNNINNKSADEIEQFFYKMLRINLWGNRCDLSIANGREVKQSGNPFELLDSFESCILADSSKDIWKCIKAGGSSSTIDIILDNAGYELFTDFVLTDFILKYNLAEKVRYHAKAIPWFISDVMNRDFQWTIKTLVANANQEVSEFGQRLAQHIADGRIELQEIDYFWTGPYEFQAMQSIAPKLYEKLSTAHMLIFKGDLNYRKLLGDINSPFSTSFVDVLGAFRPTNLCTLRTVKADLICELPDGKADELAKIDEMWMETGKYGVLHFAAKK